VDEDEFVRGGKTTTLGGAGVTGEVGSCSGMVGGMGMFESAGGTGTTEIALERSSEDGGAKMKGAEFGVVVVAVAVEVVVVVVVVVVLVAGDFSVG